MAAKRHHRKHPAAHLGQRGWPHHEHHHSAERARTCQARLGLLRLLLYGHRRSRIPAAERHCRHSRQCDRAPLRGYAIRPHATLPAASRRRRPDGSGSTDFRLLQLKNLDILPHLHNVGNSDCRHGRPGLGGQRHTSAVRLTRPGRLSGQTFRSRQKRILFRPRPLYAGSL